MIEDVLVFDNWYDDPDEVRDYALSQIETSDKILSGIRTDKGEDEFDYYPGVRTNTSIQNLLYNLEKFESLLDCNIDRSKWVVERFCDTSDLSMFSFDFEKGQMVVRDYPDIQVNVLNMGLPCNGAFQFIKKDATTWTHFDDKSTYAAVIYLTPDPPERTGTSFYKRTKTDKPDFAYSKNPDGTLIAHDPWVDVEESHHPDSWQEIRAVENVYNRCIIYPGKLFHNATGFFGDSNENCRLTQVFFFDMNDEEYLKKIEGQIQYLENQLQLKKEKLERLKR